jgi:hypothetical protein
MRRDEIPLLVVLVPVLIFVIWLKGVQARGNRETWRRVFRSWRRALGARSIGKKRRKRSR